MGNAENASILSIDQNSFKGVQWKVGQRREGETTVSIEKGKKSRVQKERGCSCGKR